VASALPLSGAASDARRYHVADPYLRFWLRFVEPIRSEIDRGIGATNVTAITRSFADYAGRAVEPIIRSGIERRIAGGDPRFGGARIVGGFWTRDNQVEVDLVGADRESPPVKSVGFVGSIKWRVARPLDGHDVADLERAASRIAGATPGTTVVGVSRTGFAGISRRIVEVTPDEILEAFPAD